MLQSVIRRGQAVNAHVPCLDISIRITDLTSSINNLKTEVGVLEMQAFAEGVLNGRIITLDKVALHETDGQRGFACQGSDLHKSHSNSIK